MAASKSGPHAPKTVCGRRHCNICGRWRHLIDFPVRCWADEAKTIVKYVQSECEPCRRAQQRERYYRFTLGQKKRRNRSSRAWHRRRRRQAGVPELGPRVRTDKKKGSVKREPFAQWLKDKIALSTLREVAHTTKLAERYINSVINGYDMSAWPVGGKPGAKRKLRPIDWESLDTVDIALTNYGEEPRVLDELYPIEDADTSTDKSALHAA